MLNKIIQIVLITKSVLIKFAAVIFVVTTICLNKNIVFSSNWNLSTPVFNPPTQKKH